MPTTFDTRLILAAVFGAAAACATGPTQQLNDAEGAARAAEEVGAPDHPRAAYHLKLATDQIAEAKPLVDGDRDDRRHAEMLLVRAEADAELALAIANTEDQQSEAKEAWAKVRSLRQDAQ